MAVATRTAPPLSVLLFAGAQGTDLATARQFLAQVRPPTKAQLLIQPGGRHLSNDVVRMVPDAFAYLTAHLARPTPITIPPAEVERRDRESGPGCLSGTPRTVVRYLGRAPTWRATIRSYSGTCGSLWSGGSG